MDLEFWEDENILINCGICQPAAAAAKLRPRLTCAGGGATMAAMRTLVVLLLLSAAYVPGALGGAAGQNLSNSTAESLDVSVAVNADNEIGAVWIEKVSDSNQRVFYSVCRGGKWSAPAAVPGQSAKNAFPCIARGLNGGFVAAWHDQALNCIRYSQYQGSWTTPLTVSQVGGNSLGYPGIATTSNGRVGVSWMRGNPNFIEVFVNTLQGGRWTGPVNVSQTAYSSKYPSLASGPGGEFYAVWQDNLYVDGEDFFVTMLSSDRGSGSWTKAVIIDQLNAWCFRPVVAANASRDILSCFYYKQGHGYWAAYFHDGDWLQPQAISDIGQHREHDLYFSAVCPFGGNGFLFAYRNVRLNIACRVVVGGALGGTEVLTDSSDCYHPDIDYSAGVGAVAAWTDRGGNCDVFVRVFEPDDDIPGPAPDGEVQPPLAVEASYLRPLLAAVDLTVEAVTDRNVFTVRPMRQLSWSFNPDWSAWGIALSKYRIYRRLKTSSAWEALGEVASGVTRYLDGQGVSEEDLFDYQVRGVDELGSESYAYNGIRWSPNPANAGQEFTVKGYRVYRKASGQPDETYVLWKALDAAASSAEDHAPEIRQGQGYDYAVSTVSSAGDESGKAAALKIVDGPGLILSSPPAGPGAGRLDLP